MFNGYFHQLAMFSLCTAFRRPLKKEGLKGIRLPRYQSPGLSAGHMFPITP